MPEANSVAWTDDDASGVETESSAQGLQCAFLGTPDESYKTRPRRRHLLEVNEVALFGRKVVGHKNLTVRLDEFQIAAERRTLRRYGADREPRAMAERNRKRRRLPREENFRRAIRGRADFHLGRILKIAGKLQPLGHSTLCSPTPEQPIRTTLWESQGSQANPFAGAEPVNV